MFVVWDFNTSLGIMTKTEDGKLPGICHLLRTGRSREGQGPWGAMGGRGAPPGGGARAAAGPRSPLLGPPTPPPRRAVTAHRSAEGLPDHLVQRHSALPALALSGRTTLIIMKIPPKILAGARDWGEGGEGGERRSCRAPQERAPHAGEHATSPPGPAHLGPAPAHAGTPHRHTSHSSFCPPSAPLYFLLFFFFKSYKIKRSAS